MDQRGLALPPDSVRILGVRVDDVTAQETLRLVESFIEEGRPRQVVTANPEFLVEAQRNHAFRVVMGECDLCLPDGVGLLWASRILGRPLRERVAGSDMVPALARLCAKRGFGIFLLGAAPGVASRAGETLQRDNPGLRIVGVHAGSPDPVEEDEIVARIRSASPDVLLVAYGAPRQDLWIHRNLARLQAPVCMGVGGTFDFIAGVVPRAPLWMRNAGLEWLYRLFIQPWRWRRMLALPEFVALVWRQRLLRALRRN